MRKIVLLFSLLVSSFILHSQRIPNDEIKDLINTFKNNIRKPYKDIRWYYTDESERRHKDPWLEKTGPTAEHARYKDAVIKLRKINHAYYLGQI
jgi:hypothetical protein